MKHELLMYYGKFKRIRIILFDNISKYLKYYTYRTIYVILQLLKRKTTMIFCIEQVNIVVKNNGVAIEAYSKILRRHFTIS